MIDRNFEGFPAGLFQFLEELAGNNERGWFTANKQRYRDNVVEPICGFIGAMAPRLQGISHAFVADARPNGGSMFRIYRDVRFSKDKRPYKEHAACHFRHCAGKDAHAPGFYVHLEPTRVLYGGGIWKPPSSVLGRIRDRIVERPEDWSEIREASDVEELFGGIGGEALKRAPRGYSEDSPHLDDIKRKTFFLMREVESVRALSAEFADEVATAFSASAPLMRFVCKAVGVAF